MIHYITNLLAPSALNTLRNTVIFFTLMFTQLFPQTCFADFSVIVHPSNISELSPKDIQRVFLRKLKSFPNGVAAKPIDLPIKSEIRQAFGLKLLKRNEQKIRSFWARQIFTGKGIPPKELSTEEIVKKFVANNKGAIGYINTKSIDQTVKSIYIF